jgi:hypothetical protein
MSLNADSLVLPPFWHFIFSKYIAFIMYLDIMYISKCILKTMYIEKLKYFIIRRQRVGRKMRVAQYDFWAQQQHSTVYIVQPWMGELDGTAIGADRSNYNHHDMSLPKY